MGKYDICVSYDTLCTVEDLLKKIQYDLESSTQKMNAAITKSGDFLAGHQFEKAKATTQRCTGITQKTSANVKQAADYIVKLRSVLDEYGTCAYKEG